MTPFYGDSNRWFIGTVVSIDDPTQLGRIKVRVDGIHGSSILDKDLPFAQTIVPITEGVTRGLGNNLGVQVGARVFGIFLDSQDSQMPLVFGSMPKYEDASAGDRSTPQLARGTNTLTKTLNLAGTIIADPYAAEYPHNKVITTTSGHAIEIDDTPNAERIHERHISGTGYEIHPEGDKVTRVKKDNYDLIYGQQYAHIRGSQSTTVNGGVKVFVNASGAGADGPPGQEVQKFHYTIQVGANANVNIQVDKGDVNVVASDGDINMKSGKDINIEATNAFRVKATTFDAEIQGAWNEKVEGDNTKTGKDITISGNTITATGDPINLN